jgi:hypothetical protein
LRDAEVNGARVVLRVGLVLLLVVLASAGLACDSRRAKKLYAEAARHVEHGDFESAVHAYDELVQKYPDTPEAGLARDEVQLYRGLVTAVDLYGARKVYDLMLSTSRALYRFESRRRSFPGALDQLSPGFLDEPPIDPWGRKLVYAAKSRRGFVLGCYGSDGQRGGDGEARDWFIEDGRFVSRPSQALP